MKKEYDLKQMKRGDLYFSNYKAFLCVKVEEGTQFYKTFVTRYSAPTKFKNIKVEISAMGYNGDESFPILVT